MKMLKLVFHICFLSDLITFAVTKTFLNVEEKMGILTPVLECLKKLLQRN